MTEQPRQASYFEAKEAARRDTATARACQWVVEHQAGWSAVLLAAMHAYDWTTGGKSAFVHLQHAAEGGYWRGSLDVWYAAHWMVVFTLVRVLTMDHLLRPFSQWWGVHTTRKQVRFCEQGWLTLYYIMSLAAGLHVMAAGPHWMNTAGFWEGYPEEHRTMTATMKAYYLVQLGFWIQQIFVLLVEERRKDFGVMLVHHIVTCTLMGSSLYMNFTRVGNAILCCMDASDIFLSGTKCMRYMKLDSLSVVSFVVFLVSWTYTRHYLYIRIMLSIANESKILTDIGWQPEIGSFYTAGIINSFLVLLAILQVLLIYWYLLILRIIYRIIFLRNLEDNRSDSEEEEDDDDHHGSNRKGGKKKAD
ncbi:Sphingosine N-acyltransferase lag1 [Coemansia sp. RSA 552]|nr:Sphingosine N-acyltransferase lag1 [Coemansia sp. RSA 552]